MSKDVKVANQGDQADKQGGASHGYEAIACEQAPKQQATPQEIGADAHQIGWHETLITSARRVENNGRETKRSGQPDDAKQSSKFRPTAKIVSNWIRKALGKRNHD